MNENGAPTVLILGKNKRNLELLKHEAEKLKVRCLTVSCYEELDVIVNTEKEIKLCLFDITGFDSNIWEYIKWINEQNATFVVLSAVVNQQVKEGSKKMNAKELYKKPISKQLFIELISEYTK